MSLVIQNLLLFKVGWLALVMGAAANMVWLGIAFGIAMIAAHLIRSQNVEKELWLLGMTALIALGWENFLISTAGVTYANADIAVGSAPVWILVLWLAFATTLNVGMQWLKYLWMFPAAVGFIGGPLAFYAGAKLGAVQFADPTLGLIMISIGWGVLLPCIVAISTAFDGYEEVQRV